MLPKRSRNRLRDPKLRRLPTHWQIEGAEEEIPHGEQSCEILVDAVRFARVMPAVEGGAGDDGAQGAEIPGDIGVEEESVEDEERSDTGEDQRFEA